MEQEIITTAAVTPAAPIDFAELMNKQQQARTPLPPPNARAPASAPPSRIWIQIPRFARPPRLRRRLSAGQR